MLRNLFIVLSLVAVIIFPSYSDAAKVSFHNSQPASIISSITQSFTNTVNSLIDFFIPSPKTPTSTPNTVTQPEVKETTAPTQTEPTKPVVNTPPPRKTTYVTEERLEQALASLNTSLNRPATTPVQAPIINNNYYSKGGGSTAGVADAVSRTATTIKNDPVFSGTFSSDLSVTNSHGGAAVGSSNNALGANTLAFGLNNTAGGVATSTGVQNNHLNFTVVDDSNISIPGDQTALLDNFIDNDYGPTIDPQNNDSDITRTVTYVDYDGQGTYFELDDFVNYYSCNFTLSDGNGDSVNVDTCNYNGTGATSFYVDGEDLTSWLIQDDPYTFSNFDSSFNENYGNIYHAHYNFDGTNTIVNFGDNYGPILRTVHSGTYNFESITHTPYNSVDAIALGKGNISSNNQALAVGLNNTVSGVGSGAFGTNNTVTGTNAFAFGHGITNGADDSVMIGASDGAKLTIDSGGNLGFTGSATFNNTSFNGTTHFNGSISGDGNGNLSLNNTRVLAGYDRGAITASKFGMTAPSNHFYDLISSQFGVAGYGMIGGFGFGSPVIYMYDNNSENSFSVGKTVFGANPATSFTSLFTVKQNGNVGIGTTSPSTKLDVYGTIRSSTNATQYLEMTQGGIVQKDLTNGDRFSLISNGTATLGLPSGYDGGALQLQTGASKSVISGGGIGNSQLYFFTGNNLSTPKMKIEAGGNVGIGTTNPGAKLDVQGTVNFGTAGNTNGDLTVANAITVVGGTSGASTFGVTNSNVGGISIFNIGNTGTGGNTWSLSVGGNGVNGGGGAGVNEGNFVIKNNTDGNNRFIITKTTGNVGIGNTAPDARLHVTTVAANAFNVGLIISNPNFTTAGTAGAGLAFINEGAGALNFTAKIMAIRTSSFSQGDLAFFTNGTGVDLTDRTTEKMRILANGNVGIGTAAPAYLLDLNSNTAIASTTETDAIRIFGAQSAANAGGLLGIKFNQNGGVAGSREAGIFSVSEAGFSNSVGLAFYTQPQAGSFTEKLRIGANGNLGIGTTTPSQKLVVVGNAQFTGVGSATQANDLRITADGTLTTNTSDRRLKTNLDPIDASSTLDKVLTLQPYYYNWINDPQGQKDLGLIAQDAASVFPEITFTNKSDGYMGINYSRLPVLLVSAVQELAHRLAELAHLVKTDEVNTKKICVSDDSGNQTCITKAQLDNLLQNQNMSSGSSSVVNSESTQETPPASTSSSESDAPESSQTQEPATDPAPQSEAPIE